MAVDSFKSAASGGTAQNEKYFLKGTGTFTLNLAADGYAISSENPFEIDSVLNSAGDSEHYGAIGAVASAKLGMDLTTGQEDVPSKPIETYMTGFAVAPNGNYVASTNNTVYYSTDQGANWTSVSLTNQNTFYAMATGDDFVYVSGQRSNNNPAVWRSSDGISWSSDFRVSTDTTQASRLVYVGNGSLATMLQNNDSLYFSSDNGSSWTDTGEDGYTLSADPSTGLYYSRDDGNRYNLNVFKGASRIDTFSSGDTGHSTGEVIDCQAGKGDSIIFFSGDNTRYYYSTNGGASWNNRNHDLGTTNFVQAVHDRFYAFGSSGYLEFDENFNELSRESRVGNRPEVASGHSVTAFDNLVVVNSGNDWVQYDALEYSTSMSIEKLNGNFVSPD